MVLVIVSETMRFIEFMQKNRDIGHIIGIINFSLIRANWYNDPKHSDIKYLEDSLNSLRSAVLYLEDHIEKYEGEIQSCK